MTGEDHRDWSTEGAVVQWTCMCTVFMCPNGFRVVLPKIGTDEEMRTALMGKLRENGWGNDRMGVLCKDHKASHKMGRA